MKRGLVLITCAALVTVFAGCASTGDKKQEAYRCNFPDTQVAAPDWICDKAVPGWEVQASGTGEPTAAGHDFQKQMAMASARVALAQQLKVHVKNLITKFTQVSGIGKGEAVDNVNKSATQTITDQSLEGSKIIESVKGPDGKLYVLMGLDSKAAEQLTQAAIKTSYKNDQALWQQFQAKKGIDELASEIAKQRAADGK